MRGVALLVSAWIETVLTGALSQLDEVALLVSAWIETIGEWKKLVSNVVALLVSAWIETWRQEPVRPVLPSHSS